MLRWNKALWLAVPNDMTIFNKPECFISVWLSYYTLKCFMTSTPGFESQTSFCSNYLLLNTLAWEYFWLENTFILWTFKSMIWPHLWFFSFLKSGPFPASFSFIFVFSIQLIINKCSIKFCRWLESNRGPLVLKATALPTAPQPLPYFDSFQQGQSSGVKKQMNCSQS